MSGTYGADVATRVNVAKWHAMKQDPKLSLAYAIVRCHRSSGKVDDNAPATIADAWEAGLAWVDVYHFPHFATTPGHAKAQIDASVDALQKAGARFGRYWIDVEWVDAQKQTGWSHDPVQNVVFLRELVKAVEARGLPVGIYTSSYNWQTITGDDRSFCEYPLWYAHYDHKASFDDFPSRKYGSFGGWKKPLLKQYAGDVTYKAGGAGVVCYDPDWSPDEEAQPATDHRPAQPTT
jgi:GH25 family lysozyme M1 (1,4-beta-N-acetylmuramidase)